MSILVLDRVLILTNFLNPKYVKFDRSYTNSDSSWHLQSSFKCLYPSKYLLLLQHFYISADYLADTPKQKHHGNNSMKYSLSTYKFLYAALKECCKINVADLTN